MVKHSSKTKINLGCGPHNFGADWLHVDTEPFGHVEWDDIWNLPVDENSCDIIYASHLLAYIDRRDAIVLLKKWRSYLKSKGVLRIAVTDFEAIVKCYKKHGLEILHGPMYGKMKTNGEIIHCKAVYDQTLLTRTLHRAGFGKVSRYDCQSTEHSLIIDHSHACIPPGNKKNGVLISLNMEARN